VWGFFRAQDKRIADSSVTVEKVPVSTQRAQRAQRAQRITLPKFSAADVAYVASAPSRDLFQERFNSWVPLQTTIRQADELADGRLRNRLSKRFQSSESPPLGFAIESVGVSGKSGVLARHPFGFSSTAPILLWVKPIRLSAHALGYMAIRGFTVTDVEDTIRTCKWTAADKGNRKECSKDFAFNAKWNGKQYSTRRVRPIFVDETTEIVVVTVYTYYF